MALPTPPPRKSNTVSAPTPAPARREAKKFSVGAWSSKGRGDKILLYAASGMGKTSLAATAPDPVFIGLDDGGAKIKDPTTGADLNRIEGIYDFQDVRDALSQPEIFAPYKTVVIDTVSVLQDLAVPYVLTVIPVSQAKGPANNIESYGYGKGYRHIYDAMLGILVLLDTLAQRGKHILLVAQSEIVSAPNAESENFLMEGPKLQHNKEDVAGLYRQWVDHIFRIGYQGVVVKEKKVVAGCMTRAIFTRPELWFHAKTKAPLSQVEGNGAISFADPADDSLWRFMQLK